MKKWKQKLTILLLICIMAGLPCASVMAGDGETQFHVSIVHTNDIHGRYQSSDDSQILGLERVKTFADQKAAAADEMLLLDAGDYFHGQSMATLDQGESAAELMAACGYDAMAPGNHDWNYGKDRLKELEGKVKDNEGSGSDFAILAGNVVDEQGDQYFQQSYLIREVKKDGVVLKIGVFGVIDPKVYQSTAPYNVEGLTFTDMSVYAKKAAEDLRSQGCQIVIGLAHCMDPKGLAGQVDGVDLWIAGHEHYEINGTVTTPDGGTSLVVETGYYLWTIGDVEINCTLDKDGELTDLSLEEDLVSYEEGTKIEKDSSISSLLDEINEDQKGILQQEVGYAPEEMDGVWEHVRIGETTLSRAITNGYLLATGAEVAFENAGGIRASIEKGSVTYGDVLNVAPYGNYVVTVDLKGSEILSMMETSLDIMLKNIEANDAGDYYGWPANSGSVLQTAGMKIVYDPAQAKGERITEASVQGQPLDPDRVYRTAMTNYLLTDTADFPELTGKTTVNEYAACEDVLAAYLAPEREQQVLADIHTEGLVKIDSQTPEDGEEPEDQPKEEETVQTDSEQTGQNATAAKQDAEVKAAKTGDDNSIAVYVCLLAGTGVLLAADRKRKSEKI